MNTQGASSLVLFALSTLLVLPTAPVAAQPPSSAPAAQVRPGAGYEDPEGIPVRPSTPDIAPVYRGPSIDTLATIRKRGVLRVGVSSSEPMVMRDTREQLVGFSIDLSRQLADDLGVQVEFVESSWSHIIADLLDNQFDVIISGLWVTPARALVVNYTDSTASEGIHLIANRRLAGGMKSIDDFNRPDVRLAVYAGTIQEAVASRLFPRATLVRVEADDLEMTPVLEGKAHGLLVPTFAPQLIVQAAGDTLFLPLREPVQSTISAMAVRKGDPDFLNFLNSWLRFQRDTGWLDERSRHWAGVMK